MQDENKEVVCEEHEEGIETGCNPSPWAPCSECQYKKKYRIVRRIFRLNNCLCENEIKKDFA